MSQHPSCLVCQLNTQQGLPYQTLTEANFINYSLNYTVLRAARMAKYSSPDYQPCDGWKWKTRAEAQMALRIAKDLRCEGFSCTHERTYRVDCSVLRVAHINGHTEAIVDLERWSLEFLLISKHRCNIKMIPDDYRGPLFKTYKTYKALQFFRC